MDSSPFKGEVRRGMGYLSEWDCFKNQCPAGLTRRALSLPQSKTAVNLIS